MGKVNFGANNSLFSNIYSQDSVYKTTMKTQGQVVTYDITLNYKNEQATLYLKNLLLNGKAPDFLVDQLACRAGNPLYPLTLSLTPHGGIHKIVNYAEILSRWNSVKNDLFTYYKDSYSQNYLQQNNDFYNSEILLNTRIQNTAFFFLFFGGIYQRELDQDFYREYSCKYKGVEYYFSERVDALTDDQDCFSLYREGVHEDRTEKLSMRYLLRNSDKNIEKAFFTLYKNGRAEQQLSLEESEIQSVVMKKDLSSYAAKNSVNFWIDEKNEN